MNQHPFLEDKKQRFLQAVKDAAEFNGVKIPKVKFWGYKELNHFSSGTRAHIHIETNTICIPETELENMTYEEIEETASHEVSHLIEISHNPTFQGVKQETRTGIWRPPRHYHTQFKIDPRDIIKENLEKSKKGINKKSKISTKIIKVKQSTKKEKTNSYNQDATTNIYEEAIKRLKQNEKKKISFWSKIKHFLGI